MSDETHADDGAIVAAPVSETPEQETPQTPANAEGQDEAKPDDKPRDEKGRFVQERINELTKARRQAERERDTYAAQLQHYQSQQQASVPQGEAPPSFENYTDLNQWAADVVKHATKQAQVQAEQRFSEQQQHSAQEQVFTSYAAKEREYAEKTPGYSDAYQALQSSVRFSQPVLEVLATSDIGPELVHHLGEHLDVADRLARMAPHLAAAEIARLEARLKTPKPKPVTKAPDPTPTLGGGAAASKDPDRMSVSEWLVWRNSQITK